MGTPVVGTGDGTESLLASRVPDLQFAQFVIGLCHFEAEVDSDGGEVVVCEVIIAEADEERGLAYPLVAYDHYLEQVIQLFDHW